MCAASSEAGVQSAMAEDPSFLLEHHGRLGSECLEHALPILWQELIHNDCGEHF
jgi:hypothetical protein